MIGNLLMPELAELIRQRNFNGLKEILCGFPAADVAEIFVDLKPDDEAVLLRLLPREEEYACAHVTDALAEYGVDIRTGQKATKVAERDGTVVVTT